MCGFLVHYYDLFSDSTKIASAQKNNGRLIKACINQYHKLYEKIFLPILFGQVDDCNTSSVQYFCFNDVMSGWHRVPFPCIVIQIYITTSIK